MREIRFDVKLSDLTPGLYAQPVLVNWFPHLTADQHLANGIARLDGQPEPFPDQNLIDVIFRVLP